MLKTSLAVVAGVFAFFAIVYGVGLSMRASWPEYAAVAEAMTFTLPMMIARLAIGVVATLAAGWATAKIAGKSFTSAIVLGVVLVLFFIPVHIQLWDKFPVWYHLFFLVSLIPLSFAGARVVGSSQRALPAAKQTE
jgi:hypothetical protein